MKIVFFDGYCSLCNSSVDWLIRIDKAGTLKFASLQGDHAAKLLGQKFESIDPDTVVYLRDNERFEQSTAVLRILTDIGGLWSCARIFLVVPRFIRDSVYRFIAKNRYRIMKRRETCRMPTVADKDRILD